MNNDTLRLIFLGMLGFSLLALWQNWGQWEASQLVGDDTQTAVSQSSVADAPPMSAIDGDLPTLTQPLSSGGEEEGDIPIATAQQGKVIRVETDWIEADISEKGGNVVRLNLKKHLHNGAPIPLLENESREYAAQSGLIGAVGIPNHNSNFRLESSGALTLAEGADALTVDLVANAGDVRLRKRYIFNRSDYLVSVILSARNNSAQTQNINGYFQLAHDGLPPRDYSSLLPTFFGAAMYTEESKFIKIAFDEVGKESHPLKSDNGWIGIIQRYFAAVWLPAEGDREFFMRQTKDGSVRLGVILPFAVLAPGEEATVSARLFAGAEEQDTLNQLAESGAAPGINLVVDYGWLTFVAVLLFKMLAAIQQVVYNWGGSIILLTFAVKLLFYPLSAAAYRSMAKMKEEAPRIKQLQEKYGGDRQQMQKEMMAIYREKKINPLGGCLPILVQIPVFIALYWVLLGSVELRHAPFMLWIDDLSTPDPYYVLSLIMGASMFLQMRLSPAPPDPTQAMIMKIMPIGFALFSVFFPSGLVLYWVVNTLLSIAQQWHIARRIKQQAVDKT